MKTLSICVPTYNRHTELENLYNNFLSKVIDEYNNKIEIVVCDNSDEEIAIKNKKIFDDTVIYHQNSENLGYAGNVLQCYKMASSKYIWLLPDDDEILFDDFCNLFRIILASCEEYDAYFIPYEVFDIFGNKSLCKLNRCADINDYYSKGVKPFVLLSCVIVKRNVQYLPEIEKLFSSNDFVQMALFSMALKDSSSFYYYEKPIIKYSLEFSGRFNPLKIYESMHNILFYLSKYFSVDVNKSDIDEYSSMLNMILLSDIGVFEIFELDKVRKDLEFMIKKIHSPKIMLQYFVLKLPLCVRRKIIFYKTIILYSPKFKKNKYKYLKLKSISNVY